MQVTLRENRPRFGKIVGGFFYALLLVVALGFGSALGWIKQSPLLTTIVDGKIKGALGMEPHNPFEGRRSLTVLILGVDHQISVNKWGAKVKTIEGGRSDMIMVARLDFENNRIGAVSIPRDTLVRVRSYREQKINAYHAIGGVDLAERAVETALPGVRIDRTVVLDFDAFEDIVDMVGGVEVYVSKDMKWTDTWADLYIDLKKGRQHLDGYQAMGFARYRHSDSDFERQKRQKDLMMALKQKLIEKALSAPHIMNKGMEVVGGSFTSDEAGAILLFLEKVENENIKMGMVPVVDIPGTYDLAIVQSRLRETLSEYQVLPGSSGTVYP